jgi:predicted HTH transcriptional regulator
MRLKGGQRVIESQQRYGIDIPKTVLGFDEESYMITVAGELEVLEIARAEQAILDALDHGAMTQADVRAIEGFRTTTLRRALTNLYDSARVSRSGNGRSGSPYLYEKVVPKAPDNGQES